MGLSPSGRTQPVNGCGPNQRKEQGHGSEKGDPEEGQSEEDGQENLCAKTVRQEGLTRHFLDAWTLSGGW